MTETHRLDALVVGLGFGGLYSLYLLKQLGLNVKAIDAAADVGGTWVCQDTINVYRQKLTDLQ